MMLELVCSSCLSNRVFSRATSLVPNFGAAILNFPVSTTLQGNFTIRTGYEGAIRNEKVWRCSYGGEEIPPICKPRVFRIRMRARLRLLKLLLRKMFVQASLLNISRYFQRNWRRVIIGCAAVFSLVLACISASTSAKYAPSTVPYSRLIESLETQTVEKILFEEGSSLIFFNVSNDQQQPHEKENLKKRWQYSARKIRHDEEYLFNLIRKSKVEYCSAPKSLNAVLASAIVTTVTLWVPLSPLMWLMYKQISGNSSSAAAKKRRKNLQMVKFEDVAGVDVAKAELWEIVSCLKGASNFRTLGAKFPKGVLLIGPPGTGKTLLARALAGESNVPFFAASASEFVEMFVGRGAARIRELFAIARKSAPSIIFIDELDAVGGRRGRSFNDERDQTLNQLLTEMDGFESESGVLVVAATNREEALDPALIRAGRFARRVIVREPDYEGRKQVLGVHMRGVLIKEDEVELIKKKVAELTSGFVGADLANVVNEAALLAARQGQNYVEFHNFKEAVERNKHGVGVGGGGRGGDIVKRICNFVKRDGEFNTPTTSYQLLQG